MLRHTFPVSPMIFIGRTLHNHAKRVLAIVKVFQHNLGNQDGYVDALLLEDVEEFCHDNQKIKEAIPDILRSIEKYRL